MTTHSPSLSVSFAQSPAVTETHFEALARTFACRWEACVSPTEIVAACGGDVHLAHVLWGVFGSYLPRWLGLPLLAFGGVSPRELMYDESMRMILRNLLQESPLVAEALEPGRVKELGRRRGLAGLCAVDVLSRTSGWSDVMVSALREATVSVDFEYIVRTSDRRLAMGVFSDGRRLGKNVVRLSLADVARRALDAGYGLVLNPDRPLPDWVLSVGDVVLFKEKREIRGALEWQSAHEEPFDTASPLKQRLRDPNPRTVPLEVRPFLGAFMRTELRITEPLIGECPAVDRADIHTVVVNVPRSRFSSSDEFTRALSACGWFIRTDCFVAGVSDESALAHQLTPL